MTNSEALITAARGYLLDNFNFWANKYAHERTGGDFPYTFTDNDYNLFPRYNVLSEILGQVQTLVGQSPIDLEACRQELKKISLTANNVFTTGDQNNIEINAIQEEREKFVDFIELLSVEQLKYIEPLPYRRSLSEQESQKVRQALLENWNFEGNYWEPLENLSPKPTVFLMAGNITSKDYNLIIEEIRGNAEPELFEITENGTDTEIEFGLFNLNCYETIYCDNSYQWILYGSHEGTIAFGGTWLLDFIKELFRDRLDKLNKWE